MRGSTFSSYFLEGLEVLKMVSVLAISTVLSLFALLTGLTVDIEKVLTILIPALGAWFAAWMTNRRDRQRDIQKRQSEQEKLLASQFDKQSGVWQEMTTQMREMVTQLQELAIEATTRARVAEERANRSERDLADIKLKYDEALKLIEELRRKAQRTAISKPRGERGEKC